MDENMQNNTNMPQESKGLAIAYMVLGIVSLVFFCFPYLCIPCGIVGLILGGISIATKKGGKGMAIAGLVCSILGIVIYVILAIIGASILSGIGSSL